MKQTEILKELGKRWRLLSDEQKRPFIDMSTEDKKRYQFEKDNEHLLPPPIPQQQSEDEKTPIPQQQSEEEKTPKIKKPKSSYILFCQAERSRIKKENPSMTSKEIMKEIGRVWREDVDTKKKDFYNKLARQERTKYYILLNKVKV